MLTSLCNHTNGLLGNAANHHKPASELTAVRILANPATGDAVWCGRLGVGEYVRLGSPDVPRMLRWRSGRNRGTRIGTA